MGVLNNLDLLSVGIAISAIGILGFIVFLNNRRSITNRTFLFFAVAAILWSIYNYLFNKSPSPTTALQFLRFHVFFAVWYCFGLFQLFYVFPKEKISFTKTYKFILIPVVILTAFLALTPYVFPEIAEFAPDGRPQRVINGPGIFIFGIVVVSLIISAIAIFIKKLVKSEGVEKAQIKIVLIGFLITFALHLIFNFIFPAFLNNPKYVTLGAVFIFPLVAFTTYAIMKHGLLRIKVLTTEILTFVLAVATLMEVILSENLLTTIFRSGVFLLVLGFGILLIKSVRKEVEQREKLEELTGQLTVAKLDLESANVKLRELDKLKSEFLSFASHQVKSPMAVIKGFAQLIADGSYGQVSEEAKEKAVKIKESTDRTLALVSNLLDLKKIEEGQFLKDLKFEDIDIVKLISGMVEEYKVIASNRGLAMGFECEAASIKIKADQEKVRQVIQNLLDNAVKYTEKGYIKASVKDEGDKVLITVNDSGRGLSKELQEKLFQRFVRDEKTKNEIQGTGLGLYIAKEIVNAHHGSITAESDGEGLGSRFYVRLSKV